MINLPFSLDLNNVPNAVVRCTASPDLDGVVSGSAVQGAYGVAARFAALTLDRRSSDQGPPGYRVRPSCGQPSQSSRARVAEAAARAASPEVSQPMPANRQLPITSVVAATSAWSSIGPAGRGVWRRLGTAAGMVASGLPEPAQSHRIAARLGGQVASEAQHVHPPTPSPIRVVAAVESGKHRPAGQRTDVALKPLQVPVRAAAVGGKVGGGFSGVLGDVGGHRLRVQLGLVRVSVSSTGDRPCVQLRPEPQPPHHVIPTDRRGVEPDRLARGRHQFGQHRRRVGDRGCGVVVVVAGTSAEVACWLRRIC